MHVSVTGLKTGPDSILQYLCLNILGNLLLLKNNFLDGFDEGLLNEDVFTVFDGRAHIMFWLLVSMNVGAYFNFGFKVSCVIALVYLLNNTVDNAVLFAGLITGIIFKLLEEVNFPSI